MTSMVWGKRQRVRAFKVQAALVASLCALSAISAAQQPPAQQASTPQTATPQAPTMSVQVNVVNVLATVRDKHGKIVNDLSKQDFTLTEDGRPQNIRYFTRETDLPLSLGLLVDTSMSQQRVLGQERTASHSFLDQMVREDKDKAFIIHFDREIELLQDFTSSHAKLEAALEQLSAPQFTPTSGGNSPDPGAGSGRGSGRRGGGGGGTHLYDAVYLATDESDGLMSKQQGRKALIILSDGVDRGSRETLEGAIASAQRADTIVYSILFKDDEGYGNGNRGGFGGPRIGMGGGGMGGPMGGGGMGRRGGGGYPSQQERPDGKKILEQISRQTGGRLFEVSKKQPIDDIYSQIEEELRNQYSLGYTPDRAGTAAEGYHKILLTTSRKDAGVQTRDGYYAEH